MLDGQRGQVGIRNEVSVNSRQFDELSEEIVVVLSRWRDP